MNVGYAFCIPGTPLIVILSFVVFFGYPNKFSFFILARKGGALPPPRHCEECRKAQRSNLITWFSHARLSPHVRHCEEGRSPSEAISLLASDWECHTIAPQLPEIATSHYRGSRNDNTWAMTSLSVIARKDEVLTKQSLIQYFWNSHPIVTQLPEIASGPDGPSQ